MADQAPQTYQQALDLLAVEADKNGNDFRLKLLRRPNAAASTTQVMGVFANATWQHIAEAETWISSFCGGGLYVLQVFDGKDARRQYGVITPSEVTGAPRAPNPRVCQTAAWLGPVLVSSAADASSGNGAVAQGFSLAGEPLTYGNPPRTGVDAGLSGLFADAQRRTEEAERRERELAEKERKAEMAEIHRQADQRAKDLDAKLASAIAALKPPDRPAFDVSGLVTALGAIAAPVIAAFQAAASANAQRQAEAERLRFEREKEDRAAEREMRAREREEMREILKVLTEKKPLIDPQILEMLDRQMKAGQEQTSQFGAFLKAQADAAKANLEGQAVAQRSMLQTIADVAQMQLRMQPEEKEGIDWGKVAAGVMAGLASLRPAGAPGAPPAPGAPTQALPGQAAPAPAAPLPDVPESEKLNAIEERIRKKEPPDQIIPDLKAALEDPGAKAEVDAEGGLMNVFEARLGDFAEDKANAPYIEALVDGLKKAGLFS